MSDKLTDLAVSKMNTVFDAAQHAIPAISRYTLEVTKIGCIAHLIGVLIPLLISVPLYILFHIFWGFHKKERHGDWELTAGIFFAGFLIAQSMFWILLFSSFWSFICLTHPDLYLIHLVVQKVLN